MADPRPANWFGLRCKLGRCPCETRSDRTGYWGECIACGDRFGFISRTEMDRMIDRDISAARASAPTPPAGATGEDR